MNRERLQPVDIDRLRENIETNGEFGRIETDSGRGRTVLAGTTANRRAREYLLKQLTDAGLETKVDPVGNVVGRYLPAGADPGAAPVASGSHLDSVPRGGIFDGPLGVYGALEAVRTIDDAGIELDRPIHVVSFTEEEGHRFTDGLLGSSVATGLVSPEAMLDRTDADGTMLRTALEEIGFRGGDDIDATHWNSWIELHIEQGKRLRDAGASVGVVDSIAGTIRCTVDIDGDASHSGTTWMDDRTDALVAASELVGRVERTAKELSAADGGKTVATVGELDVDPGAVNVIPGHAQLRIDIRSTDYVNMETVVNAVLDELTRLEAERNVTTRFERPYDIEPIPMTARCQQALSDAATRAELEQLSLHSGAGHDTMHLAEVTDVGLLFAPSKDGASHNPKEWTDWADCADAVRVLTGALARLAADGSVADRLTEQ